MVQKRLHEDQTNLNQRDDGVSEVSHQKSKRHFTFATVVRQVMNDLSLKEFMNTLEPVLRRVVREEIERALLPYQSSTSSSSNRFDLPHATSWQLYIEDKFPSTLFTGNKIESEVGATVKIVIREAISKKTIVTGPLSTLKVEIVALDGDFGADDLDDWTEKDFCEKIVRAREGKRPLLAGPVIIRLRDGVGYISDICFTDNSSWVRCGKFSLGVRSVQSIPNEARVREARSGAFVVKDQRGEAYKKHYPPKLGDEVWRLEKIGKDGAIHGRLSDKGIATVKDLLQLYNVEPSSLREAVGSTNKTWETIIEHANTCALDNKFFMHYDYDSGFGIIFDSIFKVIAATFDGQNPVTLDMLNMLQMGMVDVMKRNAYGNMNNLVLLNELSPLGSAVLQMSLLLEPSTSSKLENVHGPGFLQAEDFMDI